MDAKFLAKLLGNYNVRYNHGDFSSDAKFRQAFEVDHSHTLKITVTGFILKPRKEKCTNKKILNYVSLIGMIFMFIPVAATAPIDTTSWRCDTYVM